MTQYGDSKCSICKYNRYCFMNNIELFEVKGKHICYVEEQEKKNLIKRIEKLENQLKGSDKK